MKLKLCVEGCDNVGKSTIIHSITDYLTKINVPFSVYHCSNTTDWEEFFGVLNSDGIVIFDRSHIGEYVYGPKYRNCIAFEGKDYANVPAAAFGLYVYTDDFNKIHDDGLSFENSKEAWQWQDAAFRKAFDESGLPHICIEGLTPTTNEHAVTIVKYLLDIVTD